jgi:hypothetical protein
MHPKHPESDNKHPDAAPVPLARSKLRQDDAHARRTMTRAGDIDWSAAARRLELAVEALKRGGREIDRDLADAALVQCRVYAAGGEPDGECLRRPDPLLELASRYGLSLDWILRGEPRPPDRRRRRRPW